MPATNFGSEDYETSDKQPCLSEWGKDFPTPMGNTGCKSFSRGSCKEQWRAKEECSTLLEDQEAGVG